MFYRGEKLIEFLKNKDKFDLIFLDIELGNTTGIDVASHIRNKFDVTSLIQMWFKGY